MNYKFKVGDMVEVIKTGKGCGDKLIGCKVRIVSIGSYIGGPGYTVYPKIGNSGNGSYNYMIGEKTFKLIKLKNWKEKMKYV